MDLTRIGPALGLALLLAGCAGTSGTAVDGGMDSAGVAEHGADTATSAGIDEEGIGRGSRFEEPGAAADDPLQNRVVYFEFDRSDIQPEYQALVSAHGRYLSSNPAVRVRLEGHADERGSREYNIGLGERRAQAVRQLLLLQGVSPAQISTVSYGEERPAVLGSDEEAWALNRRVELVYLR